MFMAFSKKCLVFIDMYIRYIENFRMVVVLRKGELKGNFSKLN